MSETRDRFLLNRRQLLAGIGGFALLGSLIPQESGASRVTVVRGLDPGSGGSLLVSMRAALSLGVGALFGTASKTAWGKLLAAGTPVSVKVDAISPIASTSDELIIALAEKLFDHLIQPWDISIWDRSAADVKRRAFNLRSRRGRLEVHSTEKSNLPDARRAGYDSSLGYSPPWLGGSPQSSDFTKLFSPRPSILINLPAAKHHPLVGIDGALLSLALRSVSNTKRFHSSAENLAQAVAEIWRLEPLRTHALTIMDATEIVFNGGPVGLPGWSAREGALIISTDPVAVDKVALDLIERRRIAMSLTSCKENGELLLQKSTELEVGSREPEVIELYVPRL